MWIARIFKTLWALLEPRKRITFCMLIAFLFVAGALEMTGMVILFGYVRGLAVGPHGRSGPLAQLIEHFTGPLSQMSFVLLGGALVIGMLLTKNVVSSLTHFALNRFFMKVNQKVSTRLFNGYLLARFELFGARGVHEPMGNIRRVFTLFSQSFGAAAQVMADGAIVITVALLLLFVDPIMTIAGALIFGVAGTSLYGMTQRTLAEMGRVQKDANKQSAQTLREGFFGLVDGRLNNTRELFVDNYRQSLGQIAQLNRRRALITRLPQSINETLLATSIVGAVLYLTLQERSIEDSLPVLTIFAFAGLRLTAALSRISKGMQNIRQRIEEFTFFDEAMGDVAPELYVARRNEVAPNRYLATEDSSISVDGRLRQRLSMSHVSFAYPTTDKTALEDINLHVDRGEFVSICGGSGGGKTTLVLALMGMLQPQHGSITCDDTDIFRMVRRWHRNIGYVGQHAYVANRNVRDNVAFGLPPSEVEDDKVWKALELAAAAEFVRELPDGLDTELRDGGSILSGGQRQRIVIARALYKDPEILFFDEATAALDNITEQEITNAITRLSGRKTIIVVAHRLSTIVDSDRIYLLERGRIVAAGKYAELLETSPDFQALARHGKTG